MLTVQQKPYMKHHSRSVNLDVHQDIIKRCLNGERQAQYELYKLYSKAMFNTCFRIVNNFEEAEDVLQEAFLNAFKNLHRFKKESTFGAWLKRIVINHALNYIKKKKLDLVDTDHITNIAEVDEVVDFNAKTTDVVRIKDAMKKLPNGYRVIFSLYLLEGYDHKEIAEILEITESTSKSQFNRAKKKLRQLLE